jgi:hypothetical protein
MKFGKSFLIVISCCFVLTISFLVGDLFMFASSSCTETTPKNAKCTGGLTRVTYACDGTGDQVMLSCAERISNVSFQQQKIEEEDNSPEQTKTKTDTDPENMVVCYTYKTCKSKWSIIDGFSCVANESKNYKINPLTEAQCQ